MKTINSKRILSCLLLGASYLLSNAQGVIVYKTDGTKIKVPYEQLDSIGIYSADDVTPPDPGTQTITVNDLTGEWEDGGLGFSMGCSLNIADSQMTLKSEEGEVIYQGGYTLQDNVMTFVIDGTTYKSAAGLAGGKSVLILKEVYENGQENLAYIFVKKGMTITTKKEDIQGQWIWWFEMDEGEKEVRVSYKFDGNNFDMIIVAWGQRYTGTYTYENGIVRLNITTGYTSREEGTGYGWGEGDLNPVTLECDWKPLYQEYWSFNTMEGAFFVVGDEAYVLLLMPSICTKK